MEELTLESLSQDLNDLKSSIGENPDNGSVWEAIEELSAKLATEMENRDSLQKMNEERFCLLFHMLTAAQPYNKMKYDDILQNYKNFSSTNKHEKNAMDLILKPNIFE